MTGPQTCSVGATNSGLIGGVRTPLLLPERAGQAVRGGALTVVVSLPFLAKPGHTLPTSASKGSLLQQQEASSRAVRTGRQQRQPRDKHTAIILPEHHGRGQRRNVGAGLQHQASPLLPVQRH